MAVENRGVKSPAVSVRWLLFDSSLDVGRFRQVQIEVLNEGSGREAVYGFEQIRSVYVL